MAQSAVDGPVATQTIIQIEDGALSAQLPFGNFEYPPNVSKTIDRLLGAQTYRFDVVAVGTFRNKGIRQRWPKADK